jgi:hypothetical protein
MGDTMTAMARQKRSKDMKSSSTSFVIISLAFYIRTNIWQFENNKLFLISVCAFF